jgi:hypothetical protein
MKDGFLPAPEDELELFCTRNEEDRRRVINLLLRLDLEAWEAARRTRTPNRKKPD